jgi:hypothetical protein
MTHTRDIQPALDHFEDALQASCATLMTLESVNLSGRDLARDAKAMQEQIVQAIRSLREAIADLRALHDAETSGLAFGFVLGARPDLSVADNRASQFRPRRTA